MAPPKRRSSLGRGALATTRACGLAPRRWMCRGRNASPARNGRSCTLRGSVLEAAHRVSKVDDSSMYRLNSRDSSVNSFCTWTFATEAISRGFLPIVSMHGSTRTTMYTRSTMYRRGARQQAGTSDEVYRLMSTISSLRAELDAAKKSLQREHELRRQDVETERTRRERDRACERRLREIDIARERKYRKIDVNLEREYREKDLALERAFARIDHESRVATLDKLIQQSEEDTVQTKVANIPPINFDQRSKPILLRRPLASAQVLSYTALAKCSDALLLVSAFLIRPNIPIDVVVGCESPHMANWMLENGAKPTANTARVAVATQNLQIVKAVFTRLPSAEIDSGLFRDLPLGESPAIAKWLTRQYPVEVAQEYHRLSRRHQQAGDDQWSWYAKRLKRQWEWESRFDEECWQRKRRRMKRAWVEDAEES